MSKFNKELKNVFKDIQDGSLVNPLLAVERVLNAVKEATKGEIRHLSEKRDNWPEGSPVWFMSAGGCETLWALLGTLDDALEAE